VRTRCPRSASLAAGAGRRAAAALRDSCSSRPASPRPRLGPGAAPARRESSTSRRGPHPRAV
jgi:hypothetical protein